MNRAKLRPGYVKREDTPLTRRDGERLGRAVSRTAATMLKQIRDRI